MAGMEVDRPEEGNAGNVPAADTTTFKRGKMSRALKLFLTAINCVMLVLGLTGGPLILRLYYLHGGSRAWLSSWLQTGGFPIVFIPLGVCYYIRVRDHRMAVAMATATSATIPNKPRIYYMTPRLLVFSAFLGLLNGGVGFLYSFGLKYIPVSTSSILLSTQLVFTAILAFLIVRQKFTPFSINAVVLLTMGALMLGLHANGDRPAGVSKKQYYVGFFVLICAAVLTGLLLPLVELLYQKARIPITYTLVMEIQVVIASAATVFNTIGALINKDFQAASRESRTYGLGTATYYVVLVVSAIFWQFNYIGTVGVIFCANTLLAGIITAVFIPITGVLGVVFYGEKFSSDKGVSLALSIWGLAFYMYGEYKQTKIAAATMVENPNPSPPVEGA